MTTPLRNILGRLTNETTPQGTAAYTYDAASRRQSLTVTATGQTPVQNSYSFDNADRLTGITQGSTSVAMTYDADSRRATITLPNGLIESASYDAASQLTGLSYLQGTSTLGNLSYAYDLAGRRTNVGGSYARVTLPSAVSSANYDKADEVSTWGGVSSTYDSNGNLTNDGTNTYTWNARDELTALSGGATESFAYDGLGRRQSKTIAGTTTSFLYDMVNPVQELNGTTVAASLFTGLGVDETFSRTDSAGARHLLTDALGSTLALTDSTGAIQTEYTYDPFGNTTATGSSSGNPYQFTGRENDADGLYELRARYYNPATGRFISGDPLGFGGGSVNLYAYAGDDPVDLVDPSGECFIVPQPVCTVAGVATRAAVDAAAEPPYIAYYASFQALKFLGPSALLTPPGIELFEIQAAGLGIDIGFDVGKNALFHNGEQPNDEGFNGPPIMRELGGERLKPVYLPGYHGEGAPAPGCIDLAPFSVCPMPPRPTQAPSPSKGIGLAGRKTVVQGTEP